MFAKRLFHKATHRHQHHEKGLLMPDDVDFSINAHYGIPSTASILAFDPIQRLLAVGTLDGRIKVIGGDNIEGLLVSPKLLPYKYLEFLQNQGFLISITNDNDIQVWNLEKRSIACSLQWESNVTAFSVISGSSFIYVGDEYGLVSVLKYNSDDEQILQLPYYLSCDSLGEAAGFSFFHRQPIVGVLPQPCSSGHRILIAYESGLIILWDVVEAHIIVVRGDKVLELKNEPVSPNGVNTPVADDNSSHNLEEKEITALCWASTDGSVLAVGYIDGDILFWVTVKSTSQNVVKLQLSSSQKRLPVIVLQWLAKSKSDNHMDGQLLIYGGDEIGGEEILTILSLEWSSGMESLRCIGRVDLTLTGSFADMILLPSASTIRSDENASLFVLSNPGKIHIYDSSSFATSVLQPRKELPLSAVNFPSCLETIDPLMTVAELFHVYRSKEGQSKIDEMTHYNPAIKLAGNQNWPLTGGVKNHLSFGKDDKVQRLYAAGYKDGSVQIWDATYPVFSLLCVLNAEVSGENIVDSSAPVTKIDFCSYTLRLAIGNECGLVKLYNLCSSSSETSFHFVTETKSEVHNSAQVQGLRCEAVFDLHKSGVRALQFTNNGTKLAVGYECARIAVLDVNLASVTFLTESISTSNSPVISVLWKDFVHGYTKIMNESAETIPDKHIEELIFVLTKDANIVVINGHTGKMINSRPVHLKKQSSAISIYGIESYAPASESVKEEHLSKDGTVTNGVSQNTPGQGSEKVETEDQSSDAQILKESFVLLCCKDTLRLYSTKSVVQGENKSIHKVKLAKPCSWTTILKKNEKACGLVVFYQTGEIEIRSLPDLEVVKEYSLMSALRWNFKPNMEKTFSSTNSGNITMANGCEVAFICVLQGKNDFRIPHSLPSLHDEVLAAAADAAISVSNSKKKQGGNPGLLGGIVKGFKGRKSNKSNHISSTSKSKFSDLDDVFMSNPFPEPSTSTDDHETSEITIDDIDIDEPVPLASNPIHEANNKNKDKRTEREQLFDNDEDPKPRIRTREEIIAKYRKTGDASSAAGEARNKLMERQEKLERMSRQTEELRNGAEDFASLAKELAKAMENRKWYHY